MAKQSKRGEAGGEQSPKGGRAQKGGGPRAKVLKSELLHKGRKFDFERLTVAYPSGKTHQREIVRHPGAVVIVPILPDGRVVLVKVFRISLGKVCVECCAGTIEPKGEKPRACAERELVEETGYAAGKLIGLEAFYTSPGMSDELMHPFVAKKLKEVGQQLEEDEDIEVVVVKPKALWKMVERGEIRDGKSLVALMRAREAGYLKKS